MDAGPRAAAFWWVEHRIAFTLKGSDGTSQTYAFAMARGSKLQNLTVGAYDLSAFAYKSGLAGTVTDAQCVQALPASAPWTTETSVPVTVTRNDSTPVTRWRPGARWTGRNFGIAGGKAASLRRGRPG